MIIIITSICIIEKNQVSNNFSVIGNSILACRQSNNLMMMEQKKIVKSTHYFFHESKTAYILL